MISKAYITLTILEYLVTLAFAYCLGFMLGAGIIYLVLVAA